MNMFKKTVAKTPEEYLSMIEDSDRRLEMMKIDELIRKTVPSLESYIISGMIGYGSFHYVSKSKREGDWCVVALASQKNYISIYVCSIVDHKMYIAEKYAAQLPTKDTTKKHAKVSIGKSCIRFKHIDDLDLEVLKKILKEAEKSPGFEA